MYYTANVILHTTDMVAYYTAHFNVSFLYSSIHKSSFRSPVRKLHNIPVGAPGLCHAFASAHFPPKVVLAVQRLARSLRASRTMRRMFEIFSAASSSSRERFYDLRFTTANSCLADTRHADRRSIQCNYLRMTFSRVDRLSGGARKSFLISSRR